MYSYSVEINKYDPMALINCLKKLSEGIDHFEDSWRFIINAGGIDYGIYLNFDINNKEIEICNQPSDHKGEDDLYEIIKEIRKENEDD